MLKLPKPRKTILGSGATLLYQKNPIGPSIAFGVWVNGGSRAEGIGEKGLSHFVEHMVFRGTRGLSSVDIAFKLESIGGQWDAFTGKESTCYHAKVLEEHFIDLVDVFSQIVLYPTFPQESFKLEKRIIQEEIASIKESPEELAHELFFETILEGHPLSHPVTGYMKDVVSYSREDLVGFHRKHYTGRNMLIGFVGNLPFAKVERVLNDKFRSRGSRRDVSDGFAPVPKGRVRSRRINETKQSHVCIGSITVPASHPDRYALVVLANLLGGGVTSRLFQALRERSGLAYSVFTTTSFWKDTGVLCSYFSVDSKNPPRALEIFHREVEEVSAGNFTEEELQSAIAQIKGSVVFGVENVESRLFRLFQGEFYHGRYIYPGEVIREIEKVNIDKIIEVSRIYLVPERFTYTTCGPVSLRGLV